MQFLFKCMSECMSGAGNHQFDRRILQEKMEGGGKMSSDDDDDLSNGGPSLISIMATVSKLKRKVLANRDAEVTVCDSH